MSGYQDGPKLGATFYPGGQDDFHMPELISPSPQRVMPEVPTNMQEGIAYLELEAKDIRSREGRPASMASNHDQQNDYVSNHSRGRAVSMVSNIDQHDDYATNRSRGRSASMISNQDQYDGSASHHSSVLSASRLSITPGPAGYNAKYENTNASAYQNLYKNAPSQPEYKSYAKTKAADTSTKPSPFPKLRDAGANVPPSDEEKEQVLERARALVLNSNDPEMQLAWAQDALLWVEIAEGSRFPLVEDETTRPGTPKVEHQIKVDAMNIVDFLAGQNHPKALFLTATWYEVGKFGYPLDRKEAFVGYRKAAEKGYARAEYRIGTQYEGMQDMAKAVKHYKRGVDMSDSASNYRLGMMSLLGQHGFQQDYRLAVQQIQYAAETSDENAPQGAYIYGMLLARELPNIAIPESILPFDIDQARNFVEKAAYLGFAKAQLKMGSAYELCLLGCDFNAALSLHYNALAARQNEPDADMAVSKWFLCGFEGVFDKNEELAFMYAQKAAQSESATGEFAMGYFYEIGTYVKSDLQQAKNWYEKAAAHGNKDATGRLESLLQHQALSKEHEQVAITRIRSQYGSMRGKRPERLREHQAMPAMAEEEVERVPMPTRQSRSGSNNAFMAPPTVISPLSPQDNYPPSRPKSTAPYPVDDDEPHIGSYGNNSQLRPRSGPPADRPNSAFGIRPLVKTPQQGYGQDLPRPSSSVPEGRGSNPAGRLQVYSAGWEPQAPYNYRQPSPGGRQPSPGRLSGPPVVVTSGDHGRQSSIDNNQGGRNRLQKLGPNTDNPQPSLPPQNGRGYPSDPSRLSSAPLSQAAPSSRYDSLPSQQPGFARGGSPNPSYGTWTSSYSQQNSYPSDQRQSTYSLDSRHSAHSQGQRHSSYPNSADMNPYMNQRPERLDPIAQNLSQQPQRRHEFAPYNGSPAAQSRPPRSSSAAPSSQSYQSATSERPNSTAQPAQSSPNPQPPKKTGPQTFSAMGIPESKQESECVVM